ESPLSSLEPASFTCIYSSIVLQHIPPAIAVACLHDLFRLLAPGGVFVFQLPSHLQRIADVEIRPMTDDAYRASIALVSDVPSGVRPSSEIPVMLSVRNTSQGAWSQPASGPMAVGNHWLDASGQVMVQQDDARAPLLQEVAAGQEWPVLITLRAPGEPGAYVAEIDLVHEGVTWFEHKGSRTLRFPLVVSGAAADASRPAAMMTEYTVPDYPDAVVPPARPDAGEAAEDVAFPMYGVPHAEVMDIIRGQGARLVHIEEDHRAGPEWVGYRYFVAGR
ncbi:MAG: class I SAM-dependent methyltransferase, partial [Acidobacteriota bacterium]|nr:class I SAM-dependent methyltransferase [Acidobacteriota bacterium]